MTEIRDDIEYLKIELIYRELNALKEEVKRNIRPNFNPAQTAAVLNGINSLAEELKDQMDTYNDKVNKELGLK